jgi:hypothetical protein
VRGVPVPVVDVVDVVSVRNGDVSAGVTVLVRVTVMLGVPTGLARLRPVTANRVQVTVVRVVDVIAVRHRDVPTPRSVRVPVAGMVCHDVPSFPLSPCHAQIQKAGKDTATSPYAISVVIDYMRGLACGWGWR